MYLLSYCHVISAKLKSFLLSKFLMHIKSLMINIYTLTLRTKELKQTITFPDVHYKNNQLSFIKTGPYSQGVVLLEGCLLTSVRWNWPLQTPHERVIKHTTPTKPYGSDNTYTKNSYQENQHPLNIITKQ